MAAEARCPREHRRPHRRRHLGRERAGDVPRRRRAVGGPSVEDVASPEGSRPTPTWCTFYDARRAALDLVEPDAAHRALALLERRWRDEDRGDLLLVTQNVDDLHDRAGSSEVLHMHGTLRTAWCLACDAHPEWTGRTNGARARPAEPWRSGPTSCGSARCRATSTGSTERCARWTSSSPWARRARSIRRRRSSARAVPAGAHGRAQPGPERGELVVPGQPDRPGHSAGADLGRGDAGPLTRWRPTVPTCR